MQPPTPAYNATQNTTSIADKTVSGDATFALSEAENTPGPSKPKPKKKVKAKMTAKEKKERGVRCSLMLLEMPSWF
jgi:hypothetical protein